MSCHSHHRHHHHHGNNHHSSCCCHGCNSSSCCSCSCSSLPTPPPPIPDHHHHLLQTLLLLQPNPQPLKPLKPHPHPHPHAPTNKDPQLIQSLLHSLLRRVANLEASLSSIPSPPPPPPPRTPPKPTIKHLAASTIQTHFRRFLARRSRTLRDLNRLATVKSHASALRSSLSANPNPQELSHVAIDLLAQLDAIQSRDPMIREGKRAISRELLRVTEFVDKVLVREGAESGAVRGRSDTRVRFAENGSGGEAFDEMAERVFKISERDEDVTHLGNHGFCQFSDDVGLSAPLPVTMEHMRNGPKMKVGNPPSA